MEPAVKNLLNVFQTLSKTFKIVIIGNKCYFVTSIKNAIIKKLTNNKVLKEEQKLIACNQLIPKKNMLINSKTMLTRMPKDNEIYDLSFSYVLFVILSIIILFLTLTLSSLPNMQSPTYSMIYGNCCSSLSFILFLPASSQFSVLKHGV